MLFNRNISELLLLVPPLLFSITIHEFSHALAAHLLGDNTAKDNGRLTLNPVKHLDLLGTLLILMSFFIGWAKPVPVDPRNFKNPGRDMSLVAVAGPLSNLLMVFLMAFIFNFFILTSFYNHVPEFFQEPLASMVYIAFFLNIGLCFFNLLPIPPLDGFNIISYFLPPSASIFIARYRFIFFIGIIVLIATGMVGKILMPVFSFFQTQLHMEF
ncbi:MAG: site-2 protease family protein [Deltaproteobacteria bacterium]|jgi:Zn-dependent protease|nr:site-2 protease family protein [Deltaproteobacteria bacterium]